MITSIQAVKPGRIYSVLLRLGMLMDVAANGDEITPATFGKARVISHHLQPQNCNTQLSPPVPTSVDF